MRFTVSAAIFLILAASAWAQRGGAAMHASAPAQHFSAAAAQHFSSSPAPRFSSGTHMASGMPRTPHSGPITNRGGYGYNGYGARGTSRYYHQIPYLWALYPNYYDPFLFDNSGYDSAPGYGADYNGGYDPYASGYGPQQGPDPQTAYLSDQIQQLSGELSQLNAGPQPPPQVPMAPMSSAAPATPITVVLKDGKRLQVQNYAVMDQTFWDFTSQPVKKIPLASIDITASEKMSAASGADFPHLAVSSGSGQ
ncbi:MAG TPA: hypothetical protein VH325_14005 [Bryobacteraceae bacterium]|jgi:hypothetical protein|nr:hypothetical protein [Bryobacteraceae bacterium]